LNPIVYGGETIPISSLEMGSSYCLLVRIVRYTGQASCLVRYLSWSERLVRSTALARCSSESNDELDHTRADGRRTQFQSG